MKELIREDWNYVLYEQKQELILSVICGTVAIFEVSIVLNKQETSQFKDKGQAFPQILADNIRNNPTDYISRKT